MPKTNLRCTISISPPSDKSIFGFALAVAPSGVCFRSFVYRLQSYAFLSDKRNVLKKKIFNPFPVEFSGVSSVSVLFFFFSFCIQIKKSSRSISRVLYPDKSGCLSFICERCRHISLAVYPSASGEQPYISRYT